MFAEPGPEEIILPPLRADLRLRSGASESDGSPMWTLYDPLQQKHFHLHLHGLRVIRNWQAGASAAAVAERLRGDGVSIDDEDVVIMVRFMRANNLTVAGSPADTQRLRDLHERSRSTWWQWLLHHYLFFRIPLVHPDAFLQRTLPWVRPLVSKPARLLLMLIGVVGFWLALRQWYELTATVMQFLNWQGVAWYALALLLVKSAHELGHGYVAKNYGCRVPTMGLAFLVMFPMFYTDATDSWSLPVAWQRRRVAMAGIATELVIAVLSTFLWAVLPDGGLRQAAFFLATTSWVTSVLVNVSPFMRFDGYHILSDIWGIHNLQPRAFAVTRWRMREMLFGFDVPPPETFSPKWQRRLIIYTVATWIYRFTLFLGIALLVYHFAFKVLGIVLFMVEIGSFIVRPIVGELIAMWRHEWRLNYKVLRTACVAAVIIGLLLVPWHGSIGMAGVLVPARQASVYPPDDARIERIEVAAGDRVEKGEVLFVLQQPGLQIKTQMADAQMQVIQARLARRAGSPTDLALEGVLRARLGELKTRLTGLQGRIRSLRVISPISGRVAHLATLSPGQWVSRQDALLHVVSGNGMRAVAYATAKDIARVREGAKARFFPNDGSHTPIDLRVARIGGISVQQLAFPELSSRYGGPIAVKLGLKENGLHPKHGIYRVVLTPVSSLALPEMRVSGRVDIQAPPESIAGRMFRHASSVFIREIGF